MSIALLTIDADDAQFAGRRETGRFPFGRRLGLAGTGCCEQRGFDFICGCRIAERKLFDLASAELDEFERKALFAALTERIERPIFARNESLNLGLTLADHAQCGALYTTGR